MCVFVSMYRVSDFCTTMEDSELDTIVTEIQRNFPNSEYKMMLGHLHGKGIWIQCKVFPFLCPIESKEI